MGLLPRAWKKTRRKGLRKKQPAPTCPNEENLACQVVVSAVQENSTCVLSTSGAH